jgi:hypothetical protein
MTPEKPDECAIPSPDNTTSFKEELLAALLHSTTKLTRTVVERLKAADITVLAASYDPLGGLAFVKVRVPKALDDPKDGNAALFERILVGVEGIVHITEERESEVNLDDYPVVAATISMTIRRHTIYVDGKFSGDAPNDAFEGDVDCRSKKFKEEIKDGLWTRSYYLK